MAAHLKRPFSHTYWDITESRLSEEHRTEIGRLSIRGCSNAEIVRRLGVTREAVGRALERLRTVLAISTDLTPERMDAIANYREIMRFGLECAEETKALGGSTVPNLAEIRLAQSRVDALLGLVPSGVDDPVAELLAFKSAVMDVLRTTAPQDVRDLIAARLLEVRNARLS